MTQKKIELLLWVLISCTRKGTRMRQGLKQTIETWKSIKAVVFKRKRLP